MKVFVEFRCHPLLAIQKVQDIMCNMIRFECSQCHIRFPAFHPHFTPPFPLDVTRHCSNEIAEWEDDSRPRASEELAPTFTGRCRSCVDSLHKVENDECLRGVGVFSARNQQLPWYNFPGTDRVALLNITKQELFNSATVLESMLVSVGSHASFCLHV